MATGRSLPSKVSVTMTWPVRVFFGVLMVCGVLLVILQYKTMTVMQAYDQRLSERDVDIAKRREQLRVTMDIQHRVLSRLCINVAKTPAEAADCVKPLPPDPASSSLVPGNLTPTHKP